MRPDVYDFTAGTEDPDDLQAFVLAMGDAVAGLEDVMDVLRPHARWTVLYARLLPLMAAAKAELDQAHEDLDDVEAWHARRIADDREEMEAMRRDSYNW